MSRIAPAVVVIALSLAAGCAPSGGGGGGRLGSGSTAPAGTSAPAGTNDAQWRTALAALAQASSPDPVRLEPASLATFDGLVARNWPHVVPRLRAVAEAELARAIGQALGPLSILSVRAVRLDVAAPPALGASAPALAQTVELLLPAPPGSWALELSLDVGGTIPIGGTGIGIRTTLDARVSDIRVHETFLMDLARPTNPSIVSAGAPVIDLRLTLSSPDPLLAGLLSTLTQALDPIVRVALVAASLYAERELGILLQGVPQGPYWGLGGPGTQALAGAPPLEPLALAVDDEIQASHAPFGQVYPAIFDRPGQGGSVVGWRHHGDSALWTGAYLAVEAYRHDATGDPRALANAARTVRAMDVTSRLAPPGDGLLARCALPVSSPHAAAISGGSSFTGVVDGLTYAGYGDTSRDSYTGTMFGLGQAWHRLPALRAEVGPIAARLLGHLESRDWAVYQIPGQQNVGAGGPLFSVTFVQAPSAILAFSTIGALVDPARFDWLRRSAAPLADLLWFNAWVSAREMHEGYFGFSLEHMCLTTLCELDTDPGRYRAYLRLLAVLREAIGHHENPWFDSVHGFAAPPAAPAMAPQVRMALERWTLRPRRGFTIVNSQDPSIAKALYTTTRPNATGGPTSPAYTSPRSFEVAVHPVPIEKRPSTAFLWSSSPFELDGWVDPLEQHPGIDFLLPYWIARSHGLLR